MKEQIDKLVQIIKTMCNTIVCNDEFKKNVEDQLNEIEKVIEIETTENENSSKRRYDNNVQYGKNNNNVDESKKNYRIRSHPNSQQDSATGGIDQCARWVRRKNELNLNKKSKLK